MGADFNATDNANLRDVCDDMRAHVHDDFDRCASCSLVVTCQDSDLKTAFVTARKQPDHLIPAQFPDGS